MDQTILVAFLRKNCRYSNKSLLDTLNDVWFFELLLNSKILQYFSGSLSYLFTNHLKGASCTEMKTAATGGVKVNKVFLEIPQNLQENIFTGAFFKKAVSLMPTALYKKGLRHKCFPVNFVKFSRKFSFSRNICERLLLNGHWP